MRLLNLNLQRQKNRRETIVVDIDNLEPSVQKKQLPEIIPSYEDFKDNISINED